MQHKMILFYRKKSGVNKLSKLSHDPMMEMFIFETAQLLEQLEEIIINSEKSNSYSAHNINEIFRIMHTIKGSLEKLLDRARANGLLHKAEVDMSDREIYNLIFLPGFSTKDSISEFSGRGVGMDVVTKNIESVGGTVSVDSIPDKGTTITLKCSNVKSNLWHSIYNRRCFILPDRSCTFSSHGKQSLGSIIAHAGKNDADVRNLKKYLRNIQIS